MAKYTELTERFRFTETADGVTLVRGFHDDAQGHGGITSLPEVGDKISSMQLFDRSFKGEVASVEANKMGGHPNKHIYLVTYNLVDMSNMSKRDDPAAELDVITITLSGELVYLQGGEDAKYKWTSGGEIKGNIPMRIGGGHITITRLINVHDVALANVIKDTGSVNSRDVRIGGYLFPADTLLFEGATSQTTSDPKALQVTYSFAVKYISGPLYSGKDAGGDGDSKASTSYGSWQHLLNPARGEFELVQPLLYPRAALGQYTRKSTYKPRD